MGYVRVPLGRGLLVLLFPHRKVCWCIPRIVAIRTCLANRYMGCGPWLLASIEGEVKGKMEDAARLLNPILNGGLDHAVLIMVST